MSFTPRHSARAHHRTHTVRTALFSEGVRLTPGSERVVNVQFDMRINMRFDMQFDMQFCTTVHIGVIMYAAINLVTVLTKAQTNTEWSSHRICIVYTLHTLHTLYHDRNVHLHICFEIRLATIP